MTRTALTILAIAGAIKLSLIGVMGAYDPGFFFDDDSGGYVTIAENIATGHGFSAESTSPYLPNSFRTPGYPGFLAGVYAITGHFMPALVVQTGLALFIGWIIYRLGTRYANERVGLIAMTIFLVMPFSLLVSMRYLTQVLFTMSVMGAVWFFLSYLRTLKAHDLVIATALVPLAALIRPIAILLPAPFIVTLIIATLWRQISWRRAAVASAVCISVFIVGIAPWLVRNQQVFGEASLSSLMPFQLYFYDDPAIYATAHRLSFAQALEELHTHIAEVTGVPYSDNTRAYTEFSPITHVLIKEGIRVAFADPVALAQTRAVEFFKFFVRDGIRYWIERYGIDTAHGGGFAAVVTERLILFSLMLGFFYTAMRAFLTKNIPILFMTLIVLYFAVLTGVMASAGLRYPAEPLFLLLGVAGLTQVVTLMKRKTI